MRRLLRIRNARIYLIGNVVSTLGDSALWLAMAIWMKELTGSSAAAGLILFAYAAGSLCSPLGGVVADRFRRRPLLIWSNLIAAALVLLITLVHQRSQIWLVYLVIFGYGVIGSVIGPAETALVPAMVPEDLLAELNSVQQTLSEGLRLIVPLLGAGLFALVGGAVVAEIDAATFAVAVACLAALRVTEPRPERAHPAAAGGELAAGFRFLRREPVLRSITIALGLAILVIGFSESAMFSVVTVGLRHSASFVGVLMSTQGIGAVAGGLTAAIALRRLSESLLISIALALVAGGVLLLTLPSVIPVMAGMIVAGFAVPWILVAATTAIQRRTPSGLLGRVSGAFNLGLTLPQVISIGLGASLITVVSYRVLLIVIAVVVFAAALFLLSSPESARSPAPAGHPEPAATQPAATATAGSDGSEPDKPGTVTA